MGSGQPFPPPGDLPNPWIKPRSSELQVDSLLSEPPGTLVMGAYNEAVECSLELEEFWGVVVPDFHSRFIF